MVASPVSTGGSASNFIKTDIGQSGAKADVLAESRHRTRDLGNAKE